MHWVVYILLLVFMLAGMFITLMGLPGLWVMIVAIIGYAWYSRWHYVGLWTIFAVLGLAIIAELIEFLSASAGARKAGGSPRAAWGALVGGLVGALILSIPVPFIGTTIGLCIGVFAGALIGEMSVRDDHVHSLRVGLAATKARLYAIIIKLLFGVVITAIAAIKAIPWA